MKKTAEERIGEFNRFGSILGLDRMKELLECLDHPERDLKIIHVAGTNGKGSTCKYIYESLRFNNYKVGLYSSPYIELFNERIAFDGEDISEDDLERLTDTVIGKCDEIVALGHDSPTEFEVVTAIALMYFKEKGADYVILEVGLGGRGDSTNVIEKPLISVITSIDYDHTDRLGTTLSEIAFEKAGIIKSGVPVVSNVGCECPESDEASCRCLEVDDASCRCSEVDDASCRCLEVDDASCRCSEVDKTAAMAAARRVIKSRAEEKGAPFIDVSGVTAEELGIGYSREKNTAERSVKYPISMAGKHQLQNAKTAVSVLNNLSERKLVSLDSKLVAEGMFHAKQPGRFEIISDNPLVILDGAHNRGGAEALEKTVRDFGVNSKNRKVLMVVAILKDKDVPGMTEIFRRIGTDFIITEINDSRSSKAEDLAEYFLQSRSVPAIDDPRNPKAEDPAEHFLQSRSVPAIDDPRNPKAEDPAEHFLQSRSVPAIEKDAKTAVLKAIAEAPNYDMTIIAGSLYLIGEVRSEAIRSVHTRR